MNEVLTNSLSLSKHIRARSQGEGLRINERTEDPLIQCCAIAGVQHTIIEETEDVDFIHPLSRIQPDTLSELMTDVGEAISEGI